MIGTAAVNAEASVGQEEAEPVHERKEEQKAGNASAEKKNFKGVTAQAVAASTAR
jgi:hypothetical protein